MLNYLKVGDATADVHRLRRQSRRCRRRPCAIIERRFSAVARRPKQLDNARAAVWTAVTYPTRVLFMVDSCVRQHVATLAVALLTIAVPDAQLHAQPAQASGAPIVTLRAVLDSVRLRSPMLDAVRARVQVVRSARTTANTFENPMLSYQVDDTPFPGGRPLAAAFAERMTTVSVPLASLYQRGSRVAMADANVRAAEADTRAIGQRLALDAAHAYYRTALAEIEADAADNLTRWLDSVVVYNRMRVQQGVTAEADLIRSELERDRALADASIAAAELARARADLSMFLGDPAAWYGEWRIAVEDRPLALPAVQATGSSNLGTDAATSARPEVIAARARLVAATAATSIEQRLRLRELGATVGVKQSGGVNSMIAGISVPLPLFDQNRGALSGARAARAAAGFELIAQERSARADLVGSQDAARLLTERATVLAARDSAGRGARYLARTDDARAIALGAYRDGAVSLLQVLDAARAWGEARRTYYRALYAQHEAVLALLAAQGEDVATALPTLMTMPPTGTPR